MQTYTAEELCKMLNIELNGEEGQPYCCGERMNVKGGIFGPDYAKCLKCGKTIGNLLSPHISGGIPSDQAIDKLGEKSWIRLDDPESEEADSVMCNRYEPREKGVRMKPCRHCHEGRIPVRKRFVTRDMAIDAGFPEREGEFYMTEYDECPCCMDNWQECPECSKTESEEESK